MSAVSDDSVIQSVSVAAAASHRLPIPQPEHVFATVHHPKSLSTGQWTNVYHKLARKQSTVLFITENWYQKNSVPNCMSNALETGTCFLVRVFGTDFCLVHVLWALSHPYSASFTLACPCLSKACYTNAVFEHISVYQA